MNEKVAPIPAGFTTITPHLLVKDAEEAFAFNSKSFFVAKAPAELVKTNETEVLDLKNQIQKTEQQLKEL